MFNGTLEAPETDEAPDLSDVVAALDRIRKALVAIFIVIVVMFGWSFMSKQALHNCVGDAGYEITVGEATACIAQN